MGKTQFTPIDIDSVTVGDVVRFIKKSHRFSSSIQWQLESHRGWLMDPHWGLMQQTSCPIWNLNLRSLDLMSITLNWQCSAKISVVTVAVKSNIKHEYLAKQQRLLETGDGRIRRRWAELELGWSADWEDTEASEQQRPVRHKDTHTERENIRTINRSDVWQVTTSLPVMYTGLVYQTTVWNADPTQQHV